MFFKHQIEEKSDLQTLFNAMDAGGSGEVDYVEFCSELGKFYKRDPLVLASMTRHWTKLELDMVYIS